MPAFDGAAVSGAQARRGIAVRIRRHASGRAERSDVRSAARDRQHEARRVFAEGREMNGIEGLPPAAQTNIDGWVIICDLCRCSQHFDCMARERFENTAMRAGWLVRGRTETKPGNGVFKDLGLRTDLCPACRMNGGVK